MGDVEKIKICDLLAFWKNLLLLSSGIEEMD
jgi:hypothetical protein